MLISLLKQYLCARLALKVLFSFLLLVLVSGFSEPIERAVYVPQAAVVCFEGEDDIAQLGAKDFLTHQESIPHLRRREQRSLAFEPVAFASPLPDVLGCFCYRKSQLDLANLNLVTGPDAPVYRLTPF